MNKPAFAALLLGAASLAAPAFAAPRDYAAAVSPKGRDAKQVALDAGRHPAEILDFLGLKRGSEVLDLLAGEGYYSQIMGRFVGPKGHILAFEPTQFSDGDSKPKWAALAKLQPNVAFMSVPWEQLMFAPNSFDFTLVHLNYHDFYWSSEKYKLPVTDPAAHLAMLFRATKPGGIVGVVDHVGRAGDTRAIVDKVHRIDPEVIKADFAKAGFALEAESDLLRVPSDDLDKLVFDPAVRGKTDRVVYRFRKPA